MRALAAQWGGEVTYTKGAEEIARTHRTLLEYTWNHTTLVAFKVDKAITYLQCSYTPGQHLAQVRRMRELLSPEHFVAVRTTWGGPAPSETAAALAAERERTDTDAAWLDERRTRLQAAAAARHAASRAL